MPPLAVWGEVDAKGVQLKKPKRRNYRKQWPGFSPLKEHIEQGGLVGAIPPVGFVVLDVDQGDATWIMAMFPPYFVTASRRPGGLHVWYPCPPGYRPPSRKWRGPDGSGGDAITGASGYVVLWGNAMQDLVEQISYGGGGLRAADFRDVAMSLTWVNYQGRPLGERREIPEESGDLTKAEPGNRNTILFTWCLGWGYEHHQEFETLSEFQEQLQELALAGRLQMPDLGPGSNGGASFEEEEALKVARSAARRVWRIKREGQESQDYPLGKNGQESALSGHHNEDSRQKSVIPRGWGGMSWEERQALYRGDPALNRHSETQSYRRSCRTRQDRERVQGRRKHNVADRLAVGQSCRSIAAQFGVSTRTIQRDARSIELPSKRQARRRLQAKAQRHARMKAALKSGEKKGEPSGIPGGDTGPPSNFFFFFRDAASSPPRVNGLMSQTGLKPVRDGPPDRVEQASRVTRQWVCRGCGHVAADVSEVEAHLRSFAVADREGHRAWEVNWE